MKFNITTTSDYSDFKPTIKKIKSLRSLLKFIESNGGRIVIIYDFQNDSYEIEIYDDYRE